MAAKINLATVSILVFLATVVGVANAATYVVGDSSGWTIPPNSSFYSTWASQHTFLVGDILVFNFPTGVHDVAVVPKASYDGCTSNNPTSLVTVGPARINLTSPGQAYFLCTFTSHCSLGQKLTVTVTAGGGSTTPPPSVAPAPKSTPPPTPSTPAPTSPPPATPTPPTPAPTTPPAAPAPAPTAGPAAPTPAPAPASGPAAPTPAPASGPAAPTPAPASGPAAPTPAPAPASGPSSSPPAPGSLSPPPPPSSAPTTATPTATMLVILVSFVIGNNYY